MSNPEAAELLDQLADAQREAGLAAVKMVPGLLMAVLPFAAALAGWRALRRQRRAVAASLVSPASPAPDPVCDDVSPPDVEQARDPAPDAGENL